MIELTLVIPCFNEQHSLSELIKNLSGLNKEIKFLIVENGSTDNSRDYLKNVEITLNQNIKILYIDKNNGYGSGVFEGLNHSKNSDLIGWIHGDLQFEFEKINDLYENLKSIYKKNKNIFYKGSRYGRSLSERFFSYFMGFTASLILGVKLKEINAQPTVFTSDLIKFLNNHPKDFRFDTYVYWTALNNDFQVFRGDYFFPPRKYGTSNWNFGILSRFKFSISLIKYFIELRKS